MPRCYIIQQQQQQQQQEAEQRVAMPIALSPRRASVAGTILSRSGTCWGRCHWRSNVGRRLAKVCLLLIVVRSIVAALAAEQVAEQAACCRASPATKHATAAIMRLSHGHAAASTHHSAASVGSIATSAAVAAASIATASTVASTSIRAATTTAIWACFVCHSCGATLHAASQYKSEGSISGGAAVPRTDS